MSLERVRFDWWLMSCLAGLVTGTSLPWPDFESGWLPIINGLEHVARLNIDHGLGEIPVLVDVSVKIKENIFPASGFRPDHPVERSGPIIYIYDEMYVNVSTSPSNDPLYRIFSRINRRYEGDPLNLMGDAHVRVRAWKQSSLPATDFRKSGIMMKANTSKVSDSYAEVDHNLGQMPCLVIVRMKMHNGSKTLVADGVGSCMQVFVNVPDRTNAYLVFGYSNTSIRLWVDSSVSGAIFDGRKHTWFDMVISEGEAEIFAWKCSSIEPQYNRRVVTKNTMDHVPSWWNLDVEYYLEPSLIRVSVLAEEPGGSNEGFRFPGAMHLGYPAPSEAGNALNHTTIGGLSYTYEEKYKFNFWQPKYYDNASTIFIAKTFGHGTNTEISNSESIYIVSWIYEEDGGCTTPVILNGLANMSVNGTSVGAQAKVHCKDGFIMKPKNTFYINNHESFTITCHKFGYWENIPSCIPKDKEVDVECNPAVDKCRDKHATCTLVPESNVYKCLCNDGYKNKEGKCKAKGEYLPKADFDSEWIWVSRGGRNSLLELEHKLGMVPMLVDIQVEVSNYVYHAIGFAADQQRQNDLSSAVIYVYDDKFINVSSYKMSDYANGLVSMGNYMWYGYQYTQSSNGRIRVQAWKAESLPVPDLFEHPTTVLRANSSTAGDSFFEMKHNLGQYPGLVVVRAEMEYNGSTFYADGVGSALNVFHNEPGMTNAHLVYGFSDSSVRVWVDSSANGAIFDGRKYTEFDMVVSEATIEIYAWKLSTLTPFFMYKFSLEDDRMPYFVEYRTNFLLGDALNVAVVEVTDETSQNRGYRFPSTSYIADRNSYMYYEKDGNAKDCVFGGFTYAYEEGLGRVFHSDEKNIKMLLYKPLNFSRPNYNTGAMVCIPKSFGNGNYSGASFNGIGTLYSWINGDCGAPPEVKNGYINTTVNGTEFGAVAVLECNHGYKQRWLDDIPVCRSDGQWKVYSRLCVPIECGEVETPTNGTMVISDRTLGNIASFQCDVGYKLDGAHTIECLASGNWSAEIPSCILQTEVSDNKTSRSTRHQESDVVIVMALTLCIIVLIENL